MSSTLNVIALISGGKDSFFSIIHCQANGHRLIALANLYPGSTNSDIEDTNSYMYQTVGHSVIPLYEEALGTPLYRQQISGTAVDAAQTYNGVPDDKDETEDLVPLLKKVIAAYPMANALCSGAILSNYQRTRVEAVAVRLGLTPLAYLWQYPLLPSPSRTSLLEDMLAVGADARIIKVSSGGLDQSHLGLNVASHSAISKLKKAMGMLGELGEGDVIGEGGEYETISVDGPAPLWKKRIDLDLKTGTWDRGTGYALCNNARLSTKIDRNETAVRVPYLLDEDSKRITAAVEIETSSVRSSERLAVEHDRNWKLPVVKASSVETGHWLSISNLTCPSKDQVKQQLLGIAAEMASRLDKKGLCCDDIAQTIVILRNMADFVPFNTTYGQLFHRALPPARVTVACGACLPDSVNVSMSVIACKDKTHPRVGLHVQSRSYWAPANIGPYSQAIASKLLPATESSHDPSSCVAIAGQIPLIPGTMTLLQDSFVKQTVLALQHLKRIARALNVHVWTGAVAYITGGNPAEVEERARTALAVWRSAYELKIEECEDDEGFDVGNAQLRRPWAKHIGQERDATTLHLEPIPKWERIDKGNIDVATPHCIVAEVTELPRDSPIEWVCAGLSLGTDGDGLAAKASFANEDGALFITDHLSGSRFGSVVINSYDEANVHENIRNIQHECPIQDLEACITKNLSQDEITFLADKGARLIPCRSLWSGHETVKAVLRWRTCANPNSKTV